MPEDTFAPHNNQQVFSDYYLDHKLPARADWQALLEPARAARERIADIFARFIPTSIEAQVEKDWVYPVLEALRHTFEVQAALKTPAGTQKPDYVFYRNPAARDANKNKTLTDAHLRGGGLAVGDAKYWDRPLDVTLASAGKSGDTFTNKNPSYQIAFYVQHAGVDWGILTNGRKWRLYHKDSAHKLNRFYEVDLPALLEAGDPAAFLYFYAFFRREAFEANDPLGLAALLTESGDFARGIGASLKRQVYEALKHVAQGFLDYAPNALSANDPAARKAIYDNSLILLYRLLFVLYAEARELLPVREPGYRDGYSLYSIKQQVAGALDAGRTLLPTSAKRWPDLKELFGIIDRGSPPLHVTTYNGGLFDPARHPFLERCTVGDARLEHALDLLCRTSDPATGERVFVDYRDLSERHLGTIYEGLLEFHLTELPEPEAGWTIALENDRGERKATGSYYTPDTIVKYIVEQTVGPVLREAVAGKTTDAQKIAAVLGVNVLDPAMGSGHFLVEATEYIARFLVDLAVSPEVGQAGAAEPDITYWKRRVVQSCVYGVDLNPLAVDLAKLSLWLSTLASERPLSFLDHHLRTGNALVGARLERLNVGGKHKARRKGTAPMPATAGQLSLLSDDALRQTMSTAVASMGEIEASAARTVDDVKAQERAYISLREELVGTYGELADLVVATHFGVIVGRGDWKQMADYAKGKSTKTPVPAWDKIIAAARSIVHSPDRKAFHWELEFPEVFFHTDGTHRGDSAGFDTVIGNPPYVRQEDLTPFKGYFEAEYADVYRGSADLSVYFLSQALRQIRRGGRAAYITSGMFRKLDYGVPLRRYLTTQHTLDELVEFGEQQVFADATTYPVIVAVRKQPPTPEATVRVRDISSLDAPARECATPEGDAPWVFVSAKLNHVLRGWNGSTPLGDVLNGPPNRGVTTGLNEVFVINQATRDALVHADPSSDALIKPFLRGEDLEPWYQKDTKSFLIFTRRGVDIDRYPELRKYLEENRERLEPMPQSWSDTRSWPGRKSGEYKWYEIQDTVDYYPAFEKPRLHSNKVSLYPTFSYNEKVAYAGNTSYVLPVPDEFVGGYLLGLLNSRVSEFYSRHVFAPKANGYYEVQPGALTRFPVPNAPDAERAAIGALAWTITNEARARYALHEKVRRRILSDLGTPGKPLNQKLSAWWTLTFPAFRAELVKAFRQEIPLKERDDWEAYLAARQAEHARHTQTIVQNETDLNARVYALFDLTADEKQTIEESTKYRYGEV